MARRKGMMKGKGKGYKNIMGKDPAVHSQSAKGMKQPQRITVPLMRVPYGKKETPLEKREYTMGVGQPVGTIKEFEEFFEDIPVKLEVPLKKIEKMKLTDKLKLKDTDKDGVADILDCKPNNPKKQDDMEVTEIEYDPSVEEESTTFQRVRGKAGAILGRVGKGAVALSKKQLEAYKEKQKAKKIEVLTEVAHPKIKELERQTERVVGIEKHIATADDEAQEKKLFAELEVEQEQLRKVQEEVTEIKVEDLNDTQLKTLAVRQKDDEFTIFGSGNPYKDELLRRIDARKGLNKEIREAEKKKAETGFFDDLFD